MKRHDKRRPDELRSLSITYGIYGYAPGSVLLSIGKTKILCAVTLQPNVPSFLRGKGAGWLTAEYALLPASTAVRTNREIAVMKRQGRSVEISRLIGRSLRAVIDLDQIGERTLVIDCDVLQADGGTRAASITAAYAALTMAQETLLASRQISKPFLRDTIAAVSVGVFADGSLVLDPDYHEDSNGIADINVIMTHSGKLIELQGGAEKEPVAWDIIPTVGALATTGITQIHNFLAQNPAPASSALDEKKSNTVPLFSLANREVRHASAS